MESIATSDYEARKVEGRCTYYGCSEVASGVCQLCRMHRAEANERRRRLRASRRDSGLCAQCGEFKTQDYMCPACRVKNGRLNRARRSGGLSEWHKSRDHLVEADGYARLRYYGRGRKGAPTVDDRDEFERRIIKVGIERYLKAAEFLASEMGRALPKVEREALRTAALGQLDLAKRACDDVIERNRYHRRNR